MTGSDRTDLLVRRDYRLCSDEEGRAVAAGLADADWYRSPVEPARLKELMARSNARAALDIALYLGLLVGSGVWLYLSLWSWWTIIPLVIYGTLYGSSADPRWHECGHGTAFRTSWINTVIYYPASFMLLRDPTIWRWSHVRHHSDTIIVARDPEIILARPPQMGDWLPNLFNLKNGPAAMSRTLRHAFGRIADADRSFIPESEQHKVVVEGRIYVAMWALVVAICVLTSSFVPLLFIIGPSFYGAWLVLILGTTQHLGLREDVLDHRLNSRTVLMNPALRFLYWNMNYHCEHHMFPTVPYHALPALHEEIRDDLPQPSSSLWAAYREVVPALRHQHRDPTWEIPRQIPSPPSNAGTSTEEKPATALSFAPTEVGDGWLDICGVDDLEVNDVARVDLGNATFAVYRLENGNFMATDGICTHSRRVHLADGLVIDGLIECPKHNGRFDIATGEPVRAPVCEAISTHPVEVREGRVLLRRTAGERQA